MAWSGVRARCVALVTAVVVAVWVGLAGAAAAQPAENANAILLTVAVHNSSGPDGASAWGSVTSDPAGIDCPPTCSAAFELGTSVRLTTVARPGYTLVDWFAEPNVDTCTQGPTCSVPMGDGALPPSVTATFQPAALLEGVTAGPGTLLISPGETELTATCKVKVQLTDGICSQRYPTGTRVTLIAQPDPGARFAGWGDYACSKSSTTCRLTLGAAVRYITARFTPYTLTIQGSEFGVVKVDPSPGGTCPLVPNGPSCQVVYGSATTVTLRREHGSPGKFWVGGCDGNFNGLLDADVCKLRLQGDELVGAGIDPAQIPPPLGAGLRVARYGKGKGRVTGLVLGRQQSLNCGAVCAISGGDRYFHVRLTAAPSKRSRFSRWSDGSRVRTRTIYLSSVNALRARFVKR